MPTHAEKRTLPYTCEQMYDLVLDVERYPEFLPWVAEAKVISNDGKTLVADVWAGFKMVRERYRSQVTMNRPRRLDIIYTEGPFKHLNNHWIFEPVEKGVRIDFFIDFEFKSRLLQGLMGAVFNEAVGRMVLSFERRARQLYGKRDG
ncbi:MAG: type II toxin-antitoxin system RatA family toxin [Rhodospirillales bacterium]|jgi:coenzyme Q-binding protein COQ10|nr:type II toxin-antitoxin system RatA family toxin [Rhodospirillales bacterium]